MYSRPLTHVVKVAMDLKPVKNEAVSLDVFLAICDDKLVAKIDSNEKRDWTVVRQISDMDKTIAALKKLNEQYEEGVTHHPFNVLAEYDKLMS